LKQKLGKVVVAVTLLVLLPQRVTLREERKLRVFENVVLRRIFGPGRDEVTGGLEEIA
jgi:hypothetical protein